MTSRKNAVDTLPARQRVRYRWLLARWWSLAQWRRVMAFLRRRFGSIRRTSIVIFSVGLGLLADHFGAGAISKGDLTGYLVSTAAMIGGTTAIVFSVSLFLLQGVSDLYSSRHLEEYVNSWRDLQLIYVVIIAITLVLFTTGLYLASLSSLGTSLAAGIISTSLGLVGFVFALIDRQYELVRQKISPVRVISFLGAKATRFLKQTERNAAQIAEILSLPDNGLTDEAALAAAYNRLLRPAIIDLGRQAELLVDISLRLSERQEFETAKLALTTAGEVLAGYLTARKTSSIALPSPVALLAIESDSQYFLAPRFEQLNRAGARFSTEGQEDLAAHVVEVYVLLANAAKNIKHLGATGENPILEQVMWSLNSYAKSGSSSPNLEVLFQGAIGLTAIAKMAAGAGLDATVNGVQENLSKIAPQSLTLNTTVVWNEVTTGFLSIIAAAFESEAIERRHVVDRSLQGIADMTVLLSRLIDAGAIANDYATSESLLKAYIDFHALLNQLLAEYETLSDDQAKARYRRDLLMLFEALRSHFRRLTNAVRPESLLAGSIGRLIFTINQTIIALLGEAEFGDVRKGLHDCLRWLVHSPYWLLDASEKFDASASSVRTLVDSTAKTGILAWHGAQG
jgi:hypothetical protein